MSRGPGAVERAITGYLAAEPREHLIRVWQGLGQGYCNDVRPWPSWTPLEVITRSILGEPDRARLQSARRAAKRIAARGEAEAEVRPPEEWRDTLRADGTRIEVHRWQFAIRPVLTETERTAEQAYWKAKRDAHHEACARAHGPARKAAVAHLGTR